MARKGLTKRQEWKFGIYNVALELQENFNAMETQTMEGSKYFVNKIVVEAKNLAKQRVPVKTGKTRASIQEKPAKYTIATITVDTWLDRWLNHGGGYYHKKTVNITAKRGTGRHFRQDWYNTRGASKKIQANKRLVSHPAYYLLRPTKELLASVKSSKTYERYMKLALKKLESDNNGK